jgi:hypothetical protein
MPFGASEALKSQRAADLMVASAPDLEKAAAAAEVAAASPAPATSSAPSAGSRFNRHGGAPAPAPVAAPSPASSSDRPTSTASHFQRNAVAPVAARRAVQSAPAAQASVSAERPPRPADLARPQASAMPASDAAPASQGYAHRLISTRQSSIPGLTPRLEAYIDELAFQKNWTAEEVSAHRAAAVKNPTASEVQFKEMFQEIQRLRRDTIQSLEQGLREHPNEVLFVLQRGDDRKFSTMSKEKAGSYRILHGSAFHSIPASATLFPAPADLFRSPEPVAVPAEKTEVAAQLPQSPEEASRSTSRSMRP